MEQVYFKPDMRKQLYFQPNMLLRLQPNSYFKPNTPRKITLKSPLYPFISSLPSLSYPILTYPTLSYPIYLTNLMTYFSLLNLFIKKDINSFSHHSVCSPFILSVFIYDGLQFSDSRSSKLLYISSLFTSLPYLYSYLIFTPPYSTLLYSQSSNQITEAYFC